MEAVDVRPPTPNDADVTERADGDAVVLEYRWTGLEGWLLLGFSVVWFAGLTLAVGQLGAADLPGFAFATVAGLAVAYWAFGQLVNRTTIRVQPGGTVAVRHGPLPWRGAVTLPAAGVVQVFLQSQSKTEKGRPYKLWDVVVLDADGRRTPLVRQLRSQERARFLEHRIERALGLTDRAVPGEDATA